MTTYLSHRVDREKIKPGDHIYTWRTAFTYAHHGIYVGENKVIHFTSDQENAKSGSGWSLSSSSAIPSSCFKSALCEYSLHETEHNCDFGSCLCTYYCGFHQPESGVIITCLNCFIGTGSLYVYEYGVSKWKHMSRIQGGICTVKPSYPPSVVIDRAIYLLKDQKGFGVYNVVRNNCEDFALYCKTGLLIDGKPATGGSAQVSSILSAAWKLPILPVAKKVVFGTSPTPLTVVVSVGLYSWDRYRTDIGVRGDVVEVAVERIGSFMLDHGY